MNDDICRDDRLISDKALEHIVAARASDEVFEKGVQYFATKDLHAIKNMRRPGFFTNFGKDLSALGFSDRDDMVAAAHEAMKRRRG